MPKRRANGEGNIRKRKDGRWEGRYTVGHDPETGKAIIKNVLGKTQAEVKEKLKRAIEENVGIDYGRAKTYTVGNWLEVWYENYAKIKMRPSTYLTYHGYIENHIKPQLGKIPLNDLTTLHLQQFYKKLLAEGRVERIEAQKQPKGLSAKTVRNMHPDSITDWLSKFSRRHDLPHINPHAFRHTMASMLYFSGVDSVSISKRLGHAQVSTTANIYAHVMESADRKNADILADVFLKKA